LGQGSLSALFFTTAVVSFSVDQDTERPVFKHEPCQTPRGGAQWTIAATQSGGGSALAKREWTFRY
jgi:hypothetical protein